MLLSAVSVLVVAQSSSEIPEGLTNNPVFLLPQKRMRISWRLSAVLSSPQRAKLISSR